MFTDKQLKDMILPLFMEQLLVMLVGIADTFVVSYAGESAVSGVSLVNSFNTIFIYMFTALAAGGAVVVSQYLGRKDEKMASESVSQLLTISSLVSVVLMVIVLVLNKIMLQTLFGRVEPEVMEACLTYLRISAYSYPALAVYNAGAAMYRSIGKTSVTMYISIVSNVINLIGNCIGVFVLHAGVAGVAWPSLIARVFSAVVITVLCYQNKYGICYRNQWILKWNKVIQKNMLTIAIPNSLESGIFQFVKVALSSVVAMFGTYQIAANGIAQSIWSLAAVVCVTMGPVFITVIGQCMGAGDTVQAERYFKKLLKVSIILAAIWNGLIFAITPLVMQGYAVEPKTRTLTIVLVLIHNVFNAVAFPFADPLGKGLRAAGVVKFSMIVSIFTTVCIRLVFSILFAVVLNMGVIGIALAMSLDWVIRGIIFWIRFTHGKWRNFRVI